MRKILFLVLCCSFFPGSSYAQNKFQLQIISEEASCFHGNDRTELSDSISLVRYLAGILNDLHGSGFLTASFDTILFNGREVEAKLYCGEKFEWLSLKKGNVPEGVLSRAGFRERFYINKPFLPAEIVRLEKAIIQQAENSGFPFGKIFLDSINLSGKDLSARLEFEPGPLFTFDTIQIEGPVHIRNSYLMRHLHISEGEPFSQKKYEDIPKLLKKLVFLEQARPAGLEFFGDKARVILYLKPRKVNQVDVLAGLLPNQGPGNKMIFTGEANLTLHNLFHSGKRIHGHWRRFDINSQTLELGYFHPKLFGSFLDGSVSLDLFKQDTSFITVNKELFLAQQGAAGRIYIGVGRRTSRALSDQDISVADVNYTSYTIGFDKENLDNPVFPRSGWSVWGEARIGNKKVIGSPEDLEDIPGQSIQAVCRFRGTGHLKLGRSFSLVSSLNAASLLARKNALFTNDLFRLGGLKTLRGFNENFYYASSFAVATAEIRIYPEEETFLFLFYDQGYIFNLLDIIRKEDAPFGTGAGISFSSNAGIFSFAWSLGKSDVQALTFNNSKIHFGYVTRF